MQRLRPPMQGQAALAHGRPQDAEVIEIRKELPPVKKASLFLFLIFFAITPAWGEEKKAFKLSPKDKCPVCGMFVAKYPDFVAGIQFRDGTYAFFDGTKDMFKYYFDLKKYAPSKKAADIDMIRVTNYYDLTLINGLEAFYVAGSDVYGPMGRELIPFSREGDAREFLKDHKGKSLFRFQGITPGLIQTLD